MALPRSFTTVTPFSKLLALILFIGLVAGAFYFGRWYQTQVTSTSVPAAVVR